MHLECMQLHLISNATNAGLHLTSFNRDAHLNTPPPLLASAVASPSAFRFLCKVSRAAVQCLLSGRSAPHTSSGGGTKTKPRTRLIRTGFEWIAAAFCCLFLCVCEVPLAVLVRSCGGGWLAHMQSLSSHRRHETIQLFGSAPPARTPRSLLL